MNQSIKAPLTTYTNGAIAVGKDLIFGWVLLTEGDDGHQQWLPLTELESHTLELVQRHLTNPIFPQELREHVAALVS